MCESHLVRHQGRALGDTHTQRLSQDANDEAKRVPRGCWNVPVTDGWCTVQTRRLQTQQVDMTRPWPGCRPLSTGYFSPLLQSSNSGARQCHQPVLRLRKSLEPWQAAWAEHGLYIPARKWGGRHISQPTEERGLQWTAATQVGRQANRAQGCWALFLQRHECLTGMVPSHEDGAAGLRGGTWTWWTGHLPRRSPCGDSQVGRTCLDSGSWGRFQRNSRKQQVWGPGDTRLAEVYTAK